MVPTKIPKTDALSKWRLKRVTEYINENIEGRLRLSDLAAAAGLSPMYFAARFRAATGRRPHDYILACRVERAQILMRQTNLALAEIALMVGFRAQAHFTDVFKRIVGDTPAKWRRAAKMHDDACARRDGDKSRLNDCDSGIIDVRAFIRQADLRAWPGEPATIAKGQAAENNIRRVLKVIDDELGDGQGWVMVSGPTVADIGLYFYLARAQTMAADLGSYPNLRNWLSRIGALFESDS